MKILINEKMNHLGNGITKRFRGLLPFVIDVETSGLNPRTDALLEVAMVPITLQADGKLVPTETYAYHVEPFPGAQLHTDALEITRIDPTHPFRFALPERQVLARMIAVMEEALEKQGCYRAVLVGHNAWFDLSFLLAASERSQIRYLPFHRFTTFDTASLSAVALGETVLARATRKAKIFFDVKEAHSAIYDANKTAELFCYIANRWNK